MKHKLHHIFILIVFLSIQNIAYSQIQKIPRVKAASVRSVNNKNMKMRVDIWSDVLCPFCYIGKRKFEKALNQFEHKNDIEVVWHSFQLDPNAVPQPGIDMYDYLAAHKGQSREWSINAHKQVTQMAKEAGLDYNFDKTVVSNSFDAHRLIQFAKTKGKDDEVEEQLFKAHFTEGKNIGDKKILAQIAKDAGLDEKETSVMLNSDAFADEVRKDAKQGEALGLQGVPFFVLDNKYGISGAQPSDTFLKGLQQAYKEYKAQ